MHVGIRIILRFPYTLHIIILKAAPGDASQDRAEPPLFLPPRPPIRGHPDLAAPWPSSAPSCGLTLTEDLRSPLSSVSYLRKALLRSALRVHKEEHGRYGSPDAPSHAVLHHAGARLVVSLTLTWQIFRGVRYKVFPCR